MIYSKADYILRRV